MLAKPKIKPKPKSVWETAAADLQSRLGYGFHNFALLLEALTHPSIAPQTHPHNQRLEFLGDRVIGLVIADALFNSHHEASEGDMARALAERVDNHSMAGIAREIGLGEVLIVQADIADEDKVLADALEAVIGAVWRDGGMHAAKQVVLHLWGTRLNTSITASNKDSKTRLQEYALAMCGTLPVYTVLDRQGPDHAPVFAVKATLDRPLTHPYHQARIHAVGRGKSRRLAEMAAATALLALIDREARHKGLG